MAERKGNLPRPKQARDYSKGHLKYTSQYYENPSFDTLDFEDSGSTDNLKNERRNERKRRMDEHISQVAETAGTVTHVKEGDSGNIKADDDEPTKGGRIATGRKGTQPASILYSATVDRPPKSRTSKSSSCVRNVVYYQNRFIILDPPEAKSRSNTSSDRSSELLQSHEAEQSPKDGKARKSQARNTGSGDDVDEIPEKFRHLIKTQVTSDFKKKRKMEMDASSVTMDARGIEIIVTDSDSGFKSRSTEANRTMWKRISRILLDNRMKGRDGPGRVIHSERPEEYRVLKKVLNIIFLTIGITLLISVVIVIIYTAVVGDPPSKPEEPEIIPDYYDGT